MEKKRKEVESRRDEKAHFCRISGHVFGWGGPCGGIPLKVGVTKLQWQSSGVFSSADPLWDSSETTRTSAPLCLHWRTIPPRLHPFNASACHTTWRRTKFSSLQLSRKPVFILLQFLEMHLFFFFSPHQKAFHDDVVTRKHTLEVFSFFLMV